METFDQDALRHRLDAIQPGHRELFALSCAERLFPSYELFDEVTGRGDVELVRSALDSLWDSIGRGRGPGRAMSAFQERCDSLIPGEDAESHPLNPIGENAVVAVAYACRCSLSENSEDAKWAAVQLYEAVDYISHTVHSISFSEANAEFKILSSDVVQAELYRQRRDLEELEQSQAAGGDFRAPLDVFRARATEEGQALRCDVAQLLEA